jgi:ATP/maltotriose-dependent transcriptional regulator MalT
MLYVPAVGGTGKAMLPIWQGYGEVTERLSIAEETVKVHVKHIMTKLRANDRTQSVAIAARRGIIQL